MTKTIEEAANKFMQTAPIEAISPYYEEDMVEMFKGGVEYALSQPLASRLTAEEKERVRRIHRDYKQKWDCSCNDRESERSFYCFSLLERIFGTDFFKEGE